MTGPSVAGSGTTGVPTPDRRDLASSAARPVAARVRALGRAGLAAAAAWWQGPRAVRWGPPAAALAGAGVGFVVAGPVAAAALSAYGAAGFVIARGLAARRAIRRAQRLAGDAVLGFAADLRAGLALGPAWRAAEEALRQAESGLFAGWPRGRGGRVREALTGGPVTVVAQRLAAATALAEACGAPLADVLDRLDAHLRAVQRAQAAADGEAAGVRASAALLAVMPVAGLGLGVAVGVDPWQVLLHTPVGSAALGLAVALQLIGIAWTARLAHIEVRP